MGIADIAARLANYGAGIIAPLERIYRCDGWTLYLTGPVPEIRHETHMIYGFKIQGTHTAQNNT
jgi:hypothetical protein